MCYNLINLHETWHTVSTSTYFQELGGKNCTDIWFVHLYIAKINDLGETKTKVLKTEKIINCLQSVNFTCGKILDLLKFLP